MGPVFFSEIFLWKPVQIPRLVGCSNHVDVKVPTLIYDTVHLFQELVANTDFAAYFICVFSHQRVKLIDEDYCRLSFQRWFSYLTKQACDILFSFTQPFWHYRSCVNWDESSVYFRSDGCCQQCFPATWRPEEQYSRAILMETGRVSEKDRLLPPSPPSLLGPVQRLPPISRWASLYLSVLRNWICRLHSFGFTLAHVLSNFCVRLFARHTYDALYRFMRSW